MPIKSKAQLRKMAMLESQGKITKKQFTEMVDSTKKPLKKLPETAKAKKKN